MSRTRPVSTNARSTASTRARAASTSTPTNASTAEPANRCARSKRSSTKTMSPMSGKNITATTSSSSTNSAHPAVRRSSATPNATIPPSPPCPRRTRTTRAEFKAARRTALNSVQHAVDQGPGIVLDGAQVVLVAQGFGVDLVHILRARRTYGEPGVVRGHLQSPDGGLVPRRRGEHRLHGFTADGFRVDLGGFEGAELRLLLPGRRGVLTGIGAGTEVRGQSRIPLGGALPGLRGHLGREQGEDDAVLVRRPHLAVPAQERRAR